MRESFVVSERVTGFEKSQSLRTGLLEHIDNRRQIALLVAAKRTTLGHVMGEDSQVVLSFFFSFSKESKHSLDDILRSNDSKLYHGGDTSRQCFPNTPRRRGSRQQKLFLKLHTKSW
ncbi:hypothetical protein CDEST_10853 [Colletotrichum destructivum]|uniref:Uncharacterized protein n=1 Tax=Colletotrichum destructivum TaxID=34406 RepID=A0AAX4IRH8_9PEZI|nr:hypothetical protein CDEST_10853 [Colletotrichum destructivum]